MGAAVTVILMKEREVVRAFEEADATSPDTACSPAALGIDPHGVGCRRLRERAIVRESGAGTDLFYLDLDAWEATRRSRRRLMVVMLILIAAGVVVALTVVGQSYQ